MMIELCMTENEVLLLTEQSWCIYSSSAGSIIYSHWLSDDATATTADLFLVAVLTLLSGIYSCDTDYLSLHSVLSLHVKKLQTCVTTPREFKCLKRDKENAEQCVCV